MNDLISTLLGETTDTGCMGSVEAPLLAPTRLRFRQKLKKKKLKEAEDAFKPLIPQAAQAKMGVKPIIPPAAEEVDKDADTAEDDDEEQAERQELGIGEQEDGVQMIELTDAQLEKLANLICDKLKSLQVEKSEKPAEKPVEKPAAAPEAPQSPQPTALNVLLNQGAQVESLLGLDNSAGSSAASLEEDRPPADLLNQGKPMPAPQPGTGKVFEAFCKVVKTL